MEACPKLGHAVWFPGGPFICSGQSSQKRKPGLDLHARPFLRMPSEAPNLRTQRRRQGERPPTVAQLTCSTWGWSHATAWKACLAAGISTTLFLLGVALSGSILGSLQLLQRGNGPFCRMISSRRLAASKAALKGDQSPALHTPSATRPSHHQDSCPKLFPLVHHA